jgi:hypothetical protein
LVVSSSWCASDEDGQSRRAHRRGKTRASHPRSVLPVERV